jgi:hypothetical protein
MLAPRAAAAALLLAAALFRIHNAWAAAPLSGFDGPFHAAYIGILHYEGRIPSSTRAGPRSTRRLTTLLSDGIWRFLPSEWTPNTVLFACIC